MPLSSEDSAIAVALINEGHTYRYVAGVLGTSPTSVLRAVRRFQEHHTYHRRPGSGRPRCTMARDDRFINLEVLRDRHLTAVEVRNRLEQARNVNISARTCRRRLWEANMTSRRPATGPELSPHHRRARLQFAREYAHWREEHWSQILFTDESRFNLRSPDGRDRVWRRPGERYAACTFTSRTPYGGGSIMVWGGISSDARTELVLIQNGALTAHRYIEEVLIPHVIPFAPHIGEDFMLMHDGARPHTARCVSHFLEDVGIDTLRWPARSPDLNPIEHVWDVLGRCIRRVLHTLNDLQVALLEEWEAVQQADIRSLISSMQTRVQAVIRVRGSNTSY